MKTKTIILAVLIILLFVLSFLWQRECSKPLPLSQMEQDSISYSQRNETSNPSNEHEKNSYALGMASYDEYRNIVNQDNGKQFCYGIHAYTDNNYEKLKDYYVGEVLGNQVRTAMIPRINKELLLGDTTICPRMFLAGFLQAVKGNIKVKNLDDDFIYKTNEYFLAKKYADYKAKNEKYLAEKEKESGVNKLPNGILYTVVKEGKGKKPNGNSTVVVTYAISLINDEVKDKREGCTVNLSNTLEGFRTAIQNMSEGSRWIVYIPSNLAYGAREVGEVKPFSTLILYVELIKTN